MRAGGRADRSRRFSRGEARVYKFQIVKRKEGERPENGLHNTQGDGGDMRTSDAPKCAYRARDAPQRIADR